MGESTGRTLLGNGNGGLDFKKVTIGVLMAAISLIGIIYAKDTADVDTLKGKVSAIERDSSEVKKDIAVIQTEVSAIKDSQKRLEVEQKEFREETKDQLRDILNAVNQLARDSSRRNP